MPQTFTDWCEAYARVEDKRSHRAIPFRLYECQKRVAWQLEAKHWLWILKARRLGLTWLLAAYAVYLMTEKENQTIVVLNQTREYAQDFLERMRLILDHLPDDKRPERKVDNKAQLTFKNGGSVRSVACTRRAIRSLSADLVIFDEAAYMDLLKDARKAAQPAVELGDGQVVAISTSGGPGGEFHDVWHQAASGKNRYRSVFLSWKELPQRDDGWYAREARENEADPLYMKREYPASAEEAFESAEGRVFPLFVRGDKFIHERTINSRWQKYRAIDFGGVDPFVCLWGAVIPGDGPSLTVDPACDNLIRELLGYSYDVSGSPADKNNHACDALRYMISSPPITGHLHIYRELFIPNSAAKGWTLTELAAEIDRLSGDEEFKNTYADAARPDLIATLKKRQMKIEKYRSLSGNLIGEIIQGIVYVNELVVGTAKNVPPGPAPVRTTTGLPDHIRKKGIW
jgi:hypothetical protein